MLLTILDLNKKYVSISYLISEKGGIEMRKEFLAVVSILALLAMGLGALLLTDSGSLGIGAAVLFFSVISFWIAAYEGGRGTALTSLPPENIVYEVVSIIRGDTSAELLLRNPGQREIFYLSLGLDKIPEETVAGDKITTIGRKLVLLESKISSKEEAKEGSTQDA